MGTSRRDLFISVASIVGAAGRPAAAAGAEDDVFIGGNENPVGPGKNALAALLREFGEAARYPYNSRLAEKDLVTAIAKTYKVAPDNVVLAGGSGEVLQTSVRAFTGAGRPLVTALGTYYDPEKWARRFDLPVKTVALDGALRLDLDGMAKASQGAGLVFISNPNNPTATLHPAKAISAFVLRLRKESPDTVILLDEAYHEYVTDPAHATAIPLALEHPNVFVLRTFSKAYGMAGLRLGYAIASPPRSRPSLATGSPTTRTSPRSPRASPPSRTCSTSSRSGPAMPRSASTPRASSRRRASSARSPRRTSYSSTWEGQPSSSGTPAQPTASAWVATSCPTRRRTPESPWGPWNR